MSGFSDFVFPFRGNLGSSCFPGNIVSVYSSFFRESYFRTFGKHGDNLLGSVFFNNSTKRSRRIFNNCSVSKCETVNYVWLHIYSSVSQGRIRRSHLENCCSDTLSKCHSKELYSGPFFIGVDFSENLPIERDIGFLSESKIVDVFIEKRFSYFLNYIDHTNVTTPIKRMGISMDPDTFV